MRNVREMQRAINVFVKKELFRDQVLPKSTSRRYYPELRDIRNHMYISSTKYRYSKIDQENLAEKINEWRKSSIDRFYFSPYKKITAAIDDSAKQMFFNENGDFIGEVKTKF